MSFCLPRLSVYAPVCLSFCLSLSRALSLTAFLSDSFCLYLSLSPAHASPSLWKPTYRLQLHRIYSLLLAAGIMKSLDQGKEVKRLRKNRDEMCEVLGRGC